MTDDIGDVSVDVKADATGFERDLEHQLSHLGDNIGKQVSDGVNKSMGPMFDDLKKNFEKLSEDINQNTKVHLEAEADTEKAKKSIEDMVSKESGKNVQLNVNAATNAAAAQIAWVARKRIVHFYIAVNMRSIRQVTTAIAALSGLRVAWSWANGLRMALMNLDRSIPIIMAVVTGIGSIGALAMHSVAGILTLGRGLLQLGPAALVLPSLLLGIAAAAGVTIIAFTKMSASVKAEFTALKPIVNDIATSVSDSFWNRALRPIIDGFKMMAPEIKRTLTGIGDAMGTLVGNLATSLSKVGAFEAIFSPIIGFIQELAKHTDAFVNILVRLGEVGSKWLPQLAAWLGGLLETFSAWLDRVSASGELDQWIQRAVDNLHILWDIIVDVVDIFTGLTKAADAAGSNGLVSLERGLRAIADAINTPAFQRTLTEFFIAADEGSRALVPAIGSLGRMIDSLSEGISAVMSVGGAAFSELLQGIFDAIGTPAVNSGLVEMMNGLKKGIEGILPYLPNLGDAIAILLPFIGFLAEQLGPVLGESIRVGTEALQFILPALEPIISFLTDVVQGAFKGVGDAIQFLSDTIGGTGLDTALVIVAGAVMLFVGVIGLIAPAIGPLVELLVGLIFGPAGFTALAAAIGGVIAPILPFIGIAAAIAAAVAGIVAALVIFFTQTELGKQILDTWVQGVKDSIQSLMDFFGPIFDAIGQAVTNFATAFGEHWQAVQDAVQRFLDWWNSSVVPVFQPVFDTINAAVQGFVQGFQDGFQWVSDVVTGFITWFSTNVGPVIGMVIDFVAQKIDEFTQAMQDIWTQVQPAIQPLVDFFVNVIGPVLPQIMQVVGIALGVLAGIIALVFIAPVATAISVIGGLIAVFVLIVTAISQAAQGISTAINVIATIFTTVFNAISTFLTAVFNGIVTYIVTSIVRLVGAVQSGLSTLGAFFTSVWNAISTGVSVAWNAIVTAVTTAINAVRTNIQTGMTAVQTVITTVWNAIRTVVTTVVNALAPIVTTAFNAIRTVVQTVMTAVQTTVTAVWNAIRTAIQTALTAIQSVVTTVWNAIRTAVTTVLNAIQSTVAQVWGQIRLAIALALQQIQATVVTVWNAIRAAIQTAMTTIQNLITTAWNAIRSLIQTVMSAIQSFITSAWNTIRSIISSAMTTIQSVVRSGFDQVLSIARSIMTSIQSAVRTGIDTVVSLFRDMGDKVVSAITSIVGRARDAGAAIVHGIADGISGAISAVTGAIGNVVDAIASHLPHSPAKEGAFSGSGWRDVMESGTALMDQFAKGLYDVDLSKRIHVPNERSLTRPNATISQATGYSNGTGAGGIGNQWNLGSGMIQVIDMSGDPMRTAQEVVNRLAERLSS